MRLHRLLAAATLAAAAAALVPSAVAGGDAEKAAHGDEAATPQVSFEAHHGAFVLRQYQLGCLSQLTYLLGGDGEAAVVDPQRDVSHYQRDAKALGLRITAVLLTHTNADFVAGHTELARDGAKVYVSAESGSKFPFEPLRDGTRVRVGPAELEAVATPGHTLDSMTFLVRVPGAAADPAYAVTGDTLFVGGIGRPDLVGGETTPVVLAAKAYNSMQRLRALPDATVVLPAHGAGSLCGAHLSPETTSTIGREKATNPYLAPMSRAKFVSRVVTGLPVAPAYFKHNVRINREGPPVVEPSADAPPRLSAADVKARVAAGAWLVDLRDATAYASGHVEGAVNIAVRGRLDTWTGIVVPFDAPIVLVGSEDEAREAAFRFRRIGLDTVAGRLDPSPDAWREGGLAVRTTRLWTPKELAAAIAAGTEPVLVDVRAPSEHADVRVGDYANLPLDAWPHFGEVLDRTAPVLFLCNSSYRSSMAVGLAERLGFRELGNLQGGLDAWISAGLPTLGTAALAGAATCPAPAPSATPSAAVPLPEPVEARALAAGLQDQPGAWAVLDVRPAFAFDEYHVPGAVRVEVAGLAAHVRGLAPGVRVVVVDRDGTVAAAAAGMLAATLSDPARSVRFLVGGTAQFHVEVEQRGGAPAAPATPSAAPAPAATPPPAPAPAPRKRPAGC